MGVRKYKRTIAKARLTAAGIGNVNRKLSQEQDGKKNWKRALTGETGRAAERAQMVAGLKIAKPRKPKRKLWKVSA